MLKPTSILCITSLVPRVGCQQRGLNLGPLELKAQASAARATSPLSARQSCSRLIHFSVPQSPVQGAELALGENSSLGSGARRPLAAQHLVLERKRENLVLPSNDSSWFRDKGSGAWGHCTRLPPCPGLPPRQKLAVVSTGC